MERAADVSVILDGNDGQGPLLLGRFPEEPEWLVLDRHRAQEGLAVVSLTIEVPLQFPCWFHQPGTVVAWFPARDAPDPSQTSEWLALVADTIHTLRQTGRAVYVHCVEGQSRSAAAVAAYLIRHQKMDAGAARRWIAARRPVRIQHHFWELLHQLKPGGNP
jgi:hypothetical protein